MSSPKKSNKIVSKSASSGRGASSVKSAQDPKMTGTKTPVAKTSASKAKTAARSVAAPVKSSKTSDKTRAVEKNVNKNKVLKGGSKAQDLGTKSSVATSTAKAAGKSAAAKAAPAKAVRPVKAVSAETKSSRQATAAAGAPKAKPAVVSASTGKTASGSGHNQSGTSKKAIVTNKTKATPAVTPAAAGKTNEKSAAAAPAKKTSASSASPAKSPVAKSPAKSAAAKPAVAKSPAVKPQPAKAAAVAAAPKSAPAAVKAPVAEKPKAANDSRPAAVKAEAKSAVAKAAPVKAPAVTSAAAPVADVKPVAAKLVVAKPDAVRPAPAPAVTKAPAPVAAPVPAAPAAHGIRQNPPYRPAVAPAMAKPVTKPGVPHAGFKAGEFIVYPAHGVGQIVAIEEQEVAGFKLELFVIDFVKDKMTLKVPMPKVLAGAIRKLSSPEAVKKALDTLTGRARVKRTMWSRRAQEYEAKINSGDLVTIAEVVRDLYRSEAQPEQSYSERQLYEAAVDRMGREVAAVQKLTESESLKLIEQHLQRGPRRGAKTEADAADADENAEGVVDEAA
jgi:CarD family transcriptional regulator